MTRALLNRLVILRVEAGRVVCTGTFATADGKATHSLLEPVLQNGEIATTVPMLPGDVIMRYDDGSNDHLPVAPRPAAPAAGAAP